MKKAKEKKKFDYEYVVGRYTKTGSKTGYITECAFLMKHQADYSLLEVAKLFDTEGTNPNDNLRYQAIIDSKTKKSVSACEISGNLCHQVIVDRKTKKSVWAPDKFSPNANFEQALPSALLMYRLACLYEGAIRIEGQEGCKFVWQFMLRHKESKEIITFGEWKGGALFWTRFSRIPKVPESFLRDVLLLIDVLISDHCPHPYDGLVAGSIA